LQKRIREAEMEWVPYIIVVGQKEGQSETFPVRDRKAGKIRKIKLEELISELKQEVGDKPFKPLPLPKTPFKKTPILRLTTLQKVTNFLQKIYQTLRAIANLLV
jgi:hypothetical protein